jgi:hypothetical protein
MPIILATWEADIRRITVQSQPRQTVCKTLISKNTQHKKGLVEWRSVECLPSKYEALSSNYSMAKKRKVKKSPTECLTNHIPHEELVPKCMNSSYNSIKKFFLNGKSI